MLWPSFGDLASKKCRGRGHIFRRTQGQLQPWLLWSNAGRTAFFDRAMSLHRALGSAHYVWARRAPSLPAPSISMS